METFNLYKAKTNLSQLVDRAVRGEEIIIAKAGRPMVRLVPLEGQSQPRELGLLKGRIRIGDDFDDPLPEEMAAAFRGERP